MQITFALISGGRWSLLHQCLASLNDPRYPRWILSSKVPPQEIVDKLRPLDRIFILEAANVSAQRNLALSSCESDFIYFLDEDCCLRNSNIAHSLREHFVCTPIIAAGGFYKNPKTISFSGRIYNHMTNLWLERANTKKPGCLVGGNFVICRERLPVIHKFDETLTFGGEEIDFFSRLDGDVLLHRDFDVDHVARHSFEDLIRRALRHGTQPSLSLSQIPSAAFWTRLALSPVLSLGALVYFALVRLRKITI